MVTNMLVFYIAFIALESSFHIDAQQFHTPTANNEEISGNSTQSVNIVWRYYTPDTLKTTIACGSARVNDIIYKLGNATAISTVATVEAIDNTNGALYRIGLKLKNLKSSDADGYYCRILFDRQPQILSYSFKLKVLDRPVFISCLQDGITTGSAGAAHFSLREGGALNSTCIVFGNPVPLLDCKTYDKNNLQQAALPPVRRNYTAKPIDNRMLIYNVRREVAKVRCVADGGPAGSQAIEQNIRVDYRPSNVILTATTLQPVKGSSITFACNADGRPAPNYRFSKKEFFTWKTVQSNNASTYFIPNIAPPSLFVYKKTFRCVPYNYLGEGASKSITIDVQAPPSIRIIVPATFEGETVKLTCFVWVANPAPEITWTDPHNKTLPHSNGNVVLPKVKREQGGTYTCKAFNGIGKPIVLSRLLSVYYGPFIHQNNTVIEKCLSQQLSLSCSADGNPTPVVELYFNGSRVAWGFSSLQYQVSDIADSDFGTYVCVAAVLSRKYSRRIRVVKSNRLNASHFNINVNPTQNTVTVSWKLLVCKSNIKKIRVEFRAKGDLDWKCKAVTSTKDDTTSLNNLEAGIQYEIRVIFVDGENNDYISQTKQIFTTEKSSMSTATILVVILVVICLIALAALIVRNIFLRRQNKQVQEQLDRMQRNSTMVQTESSRNITRNETYISGPGAGMISNSRV